VWTFDCSSDIVADFIVIGVAITITIAIATDIAILATILVPVYYIGVAIEPICFNLIAGSIPLGQDSGLRRELRKGREE